MKAIQVNNLVVRYRTLTPFSIKQSIFKLKKTNAKVKEAVKDVSFTVEKGDIVGLIGKNGSGKTTLLRCIAGIFSADEGSVDLFENTVALLSIGVGFQVQLSGYDNIYLSGMLMGYSKKQIEKKIDEIIAFSELGEYIYMPVKSYSSGMYSRLAFSITATLESDILLIDEVFSVGDAAFKKKSMERMKEIISEKNRTVVIVSHSMDTIKRFCNKAIWIESGKMMMMGDANPVIEAYENSTNTKS